MVGRATINGCKNDGEAEIHYLQTLVLGRRDHYMRLVVSAIPAIASIHYGPEGRLIFSSAGALQSDGTIWRLGADDVTVLHTDADLDIGGLAVPKAEYTLYVDLD